MENHPPSVSINMHQPYGRNGAGSPATGFSPTGAGYPATSFGPTVTTSIQPEPVPSPQDFVLWSLFNTMFCNPFCLGFIALVFSVKARDRKIAQDPAAARVLGRTAKQLNIAALCLGIISFILLIVVVVLAYQSPQRPSNL